MENHETPENTKADLKLAGLITMSVAPGLLVMAIVLGLLTTIQTFGILFAVSTLVAMVGAALFAGSWFYPEDSSTS